MSDKVYVAKVSKMYYHELKRKMSMQLVTYLVSSWQLSKLSQQE